MVNFVNCIFFFFFFFFLLFFYDLTHCCLSFCYNLIFPLSRGHVLANQQPPSPPHTLVTIKRAQPHQSLA